MKEGIVLFNNTRNTLYLRLYGVRHMVKDHSDETCCCHMGYSFRLAAMVLLYAPSISTAFAIPVLEYWLKQKT